jgi:glycine betaine/proline transport system ATP-binding protein
MMKDALIPKIEVDGVTKIFGDKPEVALSLIDQGVDVHDIQERTQQIMAVVDVSFSVNEGEIFMVMGLSGSGKSTLARCINQLYRVNRGAVYLEGKNLTQMNQKQIREIRLSRLTMMFQNFGLFPHKTILDNVGFGLKMKGIPVEDRKEKCMQVLDVVGLSKWASYRPSELSGGMQQRVGLARALATDADVLLMDEPFSALDPLIRRDMQDMFIKLQKKLKKTIIFITHDLHEAIRMGNILSIMKDGRIEQIGTAEQIVSNPATEYVSRFTEDINRSQINSIATIIKPAEALVQNQDGVQLALSRMEQLDRTALYVIDDEEKPVGIVSKYDALRAAGAGQTTINLIINDSFPKSDPNVPIADVFELMKSHFPLAVVGKDGKLQGVVSQIDIFEALAGLSVKREKNTG